MMELPFNYFPYLTYIIDKPVVLVAWAAFGVPLLLFLLILITKFYKKGSIQKLSIILLTSIGFTWVAGVLLMMILLFSGVSGIKMYFIWLLILISSLIFTIMNFNLIFKNYDETIQRVKNKKK